MIPKHILAGLLVLAVLGFSALVVLSEIYLGVGEGLLDGRVAGYTAEDARVYLGQLTPEARAFYLGTFRWLDTVFPLLMALAMAGIIWTYVPVWLRFLVILPYLYLGLDWYENALVAQILTGGLKWFDPELIAKASRMTNAKWVALLASLGLTILAWRRARGAR